MIDSGTMYRIDKVDSMPEFLMTLTSSADHWMFISSRGGLTAGRGNPDSALFPYGTVDRVYDSRSSTGALGLIALVHQGRRRIWEPFAADASREWKVERSLSRNALGTRVLFEEVLLDAGLRWRCQWSATRSLGFVRQCWVENCGSEAIWMEVLDGFRNLLPPGIDRQVQAQLSCLGDAYKDAVLLADEGLALFAMASRLTDRAEPLEALQASVVWYQGPQAQWFSLDETSKDAFVAGIMPSPVHRARGGRCAMIAGQNVLLAPGEARSWRWVLDTPLDHGAVAALRRLRKARASDHAAWIDAERDAQETELLRLVSQADGDSCTEIPLHAWHHASNVLFNIMRGGTFREGYAIDPHDFRSFVELRNKTLVPAIPPCLFQQERLSRSELVDVCLRTGQARLASLAVEYLPLSFSRRHGDPSRPWNSFAIAPLRADGTPVLDHQGNWRDIFQNWEALALSYPGYLDGFVATFLSGMSADGYNPYRISRAGVDWERPEPDHPWSNIGYWSDHQVIYLQRLLELWHAVEPGAVTAALLQDRYATVDVPYRIAAWEFMCRNPRASIVFDSTADAAITARVARQGSDGRLRQNADGTLCLESLLGKLLVIVVAKLGNLVPGGGIWMNTQRPEWNDANNALAGYGLSVVTSSQLRRMLAFLIKVLEACSADTATVSAGLASLLDFQTGQFQKIAQGEADAPAARYAWMAAMARGLDTWRQGIYGRPGSDERCPYPMAGIRSYLLSGCAVLDRLLAQARRDDGLYDAYSVLHLDNEAGTATIERLYPMLEGQVAVLASGVLDDSEGLRLLQTMAASSLYTADRHTYLLYPWRELPDFLHKNTIPRESAESPAFRQAAAEAGADFVYQDADGIWRFAARFGNAAELEKAAGSLGTASRATLLEAWEATFHHRSFTGRSGTMYAYEGLGSVYWHMVAKLLLAVQELWRTAKDPVMREASRKHYLTVRDALGYRRNPADWGAFPWEPYSHTPRGGGARQPGMTGQVKEEILTRLGEFGIQFDRGTIWAHREHLLEGEFLSTSREWTWQGATEESRTIIVPRDHVACLVAGVPFIRHRDAGSKGPCHLVWRMADGSQGQGEESLPPKIARSIFARDGQVRMVTII